MSFTIESIKSYVEGEPIVALMSPAISKRSMSMRLEKRREICETYGNGSYNYCPEGYYCVGSSYCKKKTSYVWIAGVAAVVVIIIILGIVRRCRARRAMSTQQPVVTSTVITGQETLSPQYQAQYPAGGFAPPPGDPNMAYQPYQPTYAQPPPGSPYNAPYPPTSDAPMAYPPQAAYQPAGSPVPSAYPAPAGTPATAYSSPAYSPAGQPQYVTPAPYPVPQGEAANYAPPKH
ncbi:hypothetical protein BGZ81_003537 [Podila clonocystis]|nr:hypothetical protein BGZ81_003537 [Podila clonocystis]